MVDLLDTICKRSPPEAVDVDFGTVTLGCPNHPDSHQVFLEDFLLLEAVEGAFGTSEQKAISSAGGWSFAFPLEEPTLSALSSRLARQQDKLTFLSFACAVVRSKESAEAFKTLMQGSLEATGGTIHVLKRIGGEGWKALAEGVRLHPGLLLSCVTVLKDDLDEASQEDIKVMWDALETDGWFGVGG